MNADTVSSEAFIFTKRLQHKRMVRLMAIALRKRDRASKVGDMVKAIACHHQAIAAFTMAQTIASTTQQLTQGRAISWQE